jgi:hypothetical protein
MLKYKYRQEIGIEEENGTPIKDFAVQMYLSEEGIDGQSVKDMLELFANAFTGLIEETKFPTKADMEFEKLNEQFDSYMDNGKGWS